MAGTDRYVHLTDRDDDELRQRHERQQREGLEHHIEIIGGAKARRGDGHKDNDDDDERGQQQLGCRVEPSAGWEHHDPSPSRVAA